MWKRKRKRQKIHRFQTLCFVLIMNVGNMAQTTLGPEVAMNPGKYTIQLKNGDRAGLALTGLGDVNNGAVQVIANQKETHQIWELCDFGGKYYLHNSAYNTAYVLDDSHAKTRDGNRIQTWPLNYSRAQQWTFHAADRGAENEYVIECAVPGNGVLSVNEQGNYPTYDVVLWGFPAPVGIKQVWVVNPAN